VSAAPLAKVFNAPEGDRGGPWATARSACIRSGLLPQLPTYPAMTYQVISATPADSLTQLARFTDFRVQVSHLRPRLAQRASLRSLGAAAIEAMPEYITRDTDLQGPYQFEPKVFEWILDFHLRDTES
jgi:hypothetical protein